MKPHFLGAVALADRAGCNARIFSCKWGEAGKTLNEAKPSPHFECHGDVITLSPERVSIYEWSRVPPNRTQLLIAKQFARYLRSRFTLFGSHLGINSFFGVLLIKGSVRAWFTCKPTENAARPGSSGKHRREGIVVELNGEGEHQLSRSLF